VNDTSFIAEKGRNLVLYIGEKPDAKYNWTQAAIHKNALKFD
jgi:hypothetical protein